jgi:hypothetical protein
MALDVLQSYVAISEHDSRPTNTQIDQTILNLVSIHTTDGMIVKDLKARDLANIFYSEPKQHLHGFPNHKVIMRQGRHIDVEDVLLPKALGAFCADLPACVQKVRTFLHLVGSMYHDLFAREDVAVYHVPELAR